MYRPEFDIATNQVLKEHALHNQDVIHKLATFLEIVINKQLSKDAYNQLVGLEQYR